MMMTLRAIFVICLLSVAGFGQAATDAVLGEVKAFYAAYGEDLIQKRREAIADRYDRRGTYMLGNGSKRLVTFENIKLGYTTRWNGPASFAWKDLEYEVLSPTSVVVVGQFEWRSEKDPAAKTCSYSGLVTKAAKVWTIRVEDESCPPPPSPRPPAPEPK